MIALNLLVAAILLMMFVHLSYVYVMGLKFARDHRGIPWPVYLFAIPTITVMIPFYVLLNWTIGNILFLELNVHPQFTQRCNRHLSGPDGWRKRQARFWCRNFLDPFEANGHCRHQE